MLNEHVKQRQTLLHSDNRLITRWTFPVGEKCTIDMNMQDESSSILGALCNNKQRCVVTKKHRTVGGAMGTVAAALGGRDGQRRFLQ